MAEYEKLRARRLKPGNAKTKVFDSEPSKSSPKPGKAVVLRDSGERANGGKKGKSPDKSRKEEVL